MEDLQAQSGEYLCFNLGDLAAELEKLEEELSESEESCTDEDEEDASSDNSQEEEEEEDCTELHLSLRPKRKASGRQPRTPSSDSCEETRPEKRERKKKKKKSSQPRRRKTSRDEVQCASRGSRKASSNRRASHEAVDICKRCSEEIGAKMKRGDRSKRKRKPEPTKKPSPQSKARSRRPVESSDDENACDTQGDKSIAVIIRKKKAPRKSRRKSPSPSDSSSPSPESRNPGKMRSKNNRGSPGCSTSSIDSDETCVIDIMPRARQKPSKARSGRTQKNTDKSGDGKHGCDPKPKATPQRRISSSTDSEGSSCSSHEPPKRERREAQSSRKKSDTMHRPRPNQSSDSEPEKKPYKKWKVIKPDKDPCESFFEKSNAGKCHTHGSRQTSTDIRRRDSRAMPKGQKVSGSFERSKQKSSNALSKKSKYEDAELCLKSNVQASKRKRTPREGIFTIVTSKRDLSRNASQERTAGSECYSSLCETCKNSTLNSKDAARGLIHNNMELLRALCTLEEQIHTFAGT